MHRQTIRHVSTSVWKFLPCSWWQQGALWQICMSLKHWSNYVTLVWQVRKSGNTVIFQQRIDPLNQRGTRRSPNTWTVWRFVVVVFNFDSCVERTGESLSKAGCWCRWLFWWQHINKIFSRQLLTPSLINSFTDFGPINIVDGSKEEDVQARIGKARTTFHMLNNIQKMKNLSLETK